MNSKWSCTRIKLVGVPAWQLSTIEETTPTSVCRFSKWVTKPAPMSPLQALTKAFSAQNRLGAWLGKYWSHRASPVTRRKPWSSTGLGPWSRQMTTNYLLALGSRFSIGTNLAHFQILLCNLAHFQEVEAHLKTEVQSGEYCHLNWCLPVCLWFQYR